MKQLFLLILISLFGFTIHAQSDEKYTVSGRLTDAETGEDMFSAQVVVKELPGTGTSVKDYGFYSLRLPEGEYTLIFRSVGYDNVEKNITLDKDLTIDMSFGVSDMKTLIVTDSVGPQNIGTVGGSITKIDIGRIQELPTLIEPDIIFTTTQYESGIKSAGEGNSGFYVRGGGLDQNLVILDESPVYNPSHLLGFISVFNADALKEATLFKGGMMPEYGGRTSSVLDIKMKEGNNKHFVASGGIGVLTSRLTLEGPIVKDKGSFIVSGRRSFVDLFLGLSKDEVIKDSKLFFYDFNMKANYTLSKKDRIFASGYFGRDKFGFGDSFGIGWGNGTGTFRWNHLYSNRLFSNTSIIYSNYNYEFGFGQGDEAVSLGSVIRDWNVKQDFTYIPNDKNSVKFGFNAIYHNIEPGNLNAGPGTGIQSEKSTPQLGVESSVYIQNEQEVSNRLTLGYGLRYSFFNYVGEGTSYNITAGGEILSSTEHDKWETIKFYGGLEPRFSSSYKLTPMSSVKLNYNRNYQYLHLLTNATTSSPTDVWIMSTNNVKPQIADQIAIGYFRNFKKDMYVTSFEIYYKDMQNVIDYRTGADLFLNEEIEADLVYGDGEAYGFEMSLRKTKGVFTGLVSYTLSRTLRTIDQINNGDKFPARQDRIHDLSLVGTYAISKRTKMSMAFVYYTGDAVTFPNGGYTIEGAVIPYYTQRNGYRLPDYHRLDFSLNIQGKKREKYESSWNISLYNVYGRENTFSITFQQNEDDPSITEAEQLAIFKWVPSVTYNFKF